MNDIPHYRLLPEIVEQWKRRPGRPTRDSFERYFRKERGLKGDPEHWWGPMMRGDPVPELMARAVAEYMRDRMDREDISCESLFEPTMQTARPGVWEGPNKILEALTESCTACGEMFVSNRTLDPVLAGRMIVCTVGYKASMPGEALDREACMSRGAAKMERSVDEYARWLREMCDGDELSRTVMFYVHPTTRKRLGATVVLPLKEQAFSAICAGDRGDAEISKSDLDPTSGRLLLCGMSDAEGVDGLSVHDKSVAQVKSIFYQFSYFTRRMKPLRPEVAVFITNPVYGDFLHRQGYVDTGINLKGTPYPIWVLRYPGRRNPLRWVLYSTFRQTLWLYRISNWREWREEDRARRRMS